MLPGPPRPVWQADVATTFGPTRRGLAAPVGPLSTGRAPPPARTPEDATGPRRPADPHPLDLAVRTPSPAAMGAGAASGRRNEANNSRFPCRTSKTVRPTPGGLSTVTPAIRVAACRVLGVSSGADCPITARQVPLQQASRRVRMVGGEQPAGGEHIAGVDHRAAAPAAAPSRRRVGQHRVQDRRASPPARAAAPRRSRPPAARPAGPGRRRGGRPGAGGSPRACRRSATVARPAAGRPPSAGRPPGRPVGRAGVRQLSSGRAAARRRGGHDPGRAPPHPEVALDGPGPPQRARPPRGAARLASASGSSTEYTSVVAPPTSTTSRSPAPVGRRAAPRRPAPRPGWRRAPATANRGPRDSRLPPITCRRNTSRIAARAGPGRARRCAGSTLPVAVTGTPAAGQQRGQPRRGRRRCRPPPPAPASRALASRRALCSSTVRRRRRRCRRPAAPHPAGRRAAPASAGAVQRPGRHVHDPGAGGQADPVPGLRGDQRLVADHGQPQPAAGRRAHVPASAGRRRWPRDRGVEAVQHVGVRRWSVLGRGDQPRRRPGRPAPALVYVDPTSTQTAPAHGFGGTTTVPVAVTATIGGSSTSAADSPVRSAPAHHRGSSKSMVAAAGAHPGHRRGRPPARRRPAPAPELHVGVRREQPLVAVEPDAHLGGHVAEQAQRVRAVDQVARRSGRARTARTAGGSR